MCVNRPMRTPSNEPHYIFGADRKTTDPTWHTNPMLRSSGAVLRGQYPLVQIPSLMLPFTVLPNDKCRGESTLQSSTPIPSGNDRYECSTPRMAFSKMDMQGLGVPGISFGISMGARIRCGETFGVSPPSLPLGNHQSRSPLMGSRFELPGARSRPSRLETLHALRRVYSRHPLSYASVLSRRQVPKEAPGYPVYRAHPLVPGRKKQQHERDRGDTQRTGPGSHLRQKIAATAKQKGAEHCNSSTVRVGATSAAATIIGTR